MNQDEKVAYLKALLFIALADENVDDNELGYFYRLGDLYGLTSTELDDIKHAVIDKKEPIESILTKITQRQTKISLLYELLALCYVDGNYSVAERSGLKDVCRLMNIESEKLNALENAMEENVALQKKINSILERGE